jgi:hypothetical protein
MRRFTQFMREHQEWQDAEHEYESRVYGDTVEQEQDERELSMKELMQRKAKEEALEIEFERSQEHQSRR